MASVIANRSRHEQGIGKNTSGWYCTMTLS